MHFEFLLEEPSAEKVLRNILPSLIVGEHDFRCIVYQGKMDLLKSLPIKLRGYKRWIPGAFKIIVLVDRDDDDCFELKRKLDLIATNAGLICKCNSQDNFQVMNRIAVEEIESWFFGDADAMRMAYPRLNFFERKTSFRNPDAIKNTWESLERILQQRGYFKTGLRKTEVANEVSKYMQPLKNRSKSFQVFWSGITECIANK